MTIKINKINGLLKFILQLYIILIMFLTPEDKTQILIWGSIFVVVFFYLFIEIFIKKTVKINKRELLDWVFLFFIVAINVVFSEYVTSKMLQFTMQLLAIYLSFYALNTVNSSNKRVDLFYISMTIFLAYSMFESYSNNIVLTFKNFADANYTAVLIYLYFLYCINRKYKIGIFISVLYLLINSSRLYIFLLIITFCIFIISRFHQNNTCKKEFISVNNIYKLFSFFLLFTFAFSFIWSNYIVGSNTTSYKLSLNDSSNAIRTNSNLYALKVIKNDPKLMWRGYDSEMRRVLGLDSDLLSQHKIYLGYRVVQPHNSYLNPFLTHGFAYAILYFIILGKIFSKLINKENIYIWLPYFIGCCFLHSLFTSVYLIFFIIVLDDYHKREVNNDENFSNYTS